MKCICKNYRHRLENEPFTSFSECKLILYLLTMDVYCGSPEMLTSPKTTSKLSKKSRNTRRSNIHVLHAGEGNMKMYSPKSVIFPEGNDRGEHDTRG